MEELFSGDGSSHAHSLSAFQGTPADMLASIAAKAAGRVAMFETLKHEGDDDDDESSEHDEHDEHSEPVE